MLPNLRIDDEVYVYDSAVMIDFAQPGPVKCVVKNIVHMDEPIGEMILIEYFIPKTSQRKKVFVSVRQLMRLPVGHTAHPNDQ